MALLALLANMLEIRLIGFRYARVTRRPKPSGSEGIGAWEYVRVARQG